MDFAVNSELLAEAIETCTTTATTVEEQIAEIFLKIDALGDHWEGTSYDNFKSSCEGYKDSLNQLVNLLNAFAKLLSNVAGPEETLESDIRDALS